MPDPLRKQRSEWREIGPNNPAHVRNVHDGRLVAFVAHEGGHWHLSISHRNPAGELTRYPTWDEIAHARENLLPPDAWFAMYLPPDGEYVSAHLTTFHLWECPPPEVS